MSEMKTGIVRYRKGLITTAVAVFLMASMFSAFIVVENASAHIDEGLGNALQLYSYFDSDASTKISFDSQPIVDDGIGRISGNHDEWEGAYVRNITITNFAGDDRFCYLFLANDDDYLYVGIVYQAGNTGNPNYVTIYFDEGDGGGTYDGSHDDLLTAGNENYIKSDKGENLEDGFFNGTGWQSEAVIDIADVKVAWGSSYMNFEFKIPLDNGVDNGTSSDLNVVSTDEIGIFFEINVQNTPVGGDLHYWSLTGSDPTDPNAYADLQLGMQKKTATVYSTYANTGNPIIDGDITNDFAYANAFSREISLTNFMGSTLSSTIYMCEDPTNDEIFIGMVIYTDNSDATDFLRIYTDQDHAVGPPYGGKDGVLSDGVGNFENYEQVSGDNSYTDGFWDAAGSWNEDQGSDDTDGEGAVTFMNFAGSSNDRYEFEFKLPYSPTSAYQVDGDFDLWIASPELIGFLLEFYDASATPGEQLFYWDLTTNLNAIKTRGTAGEIWLSTGWAYLQTGGPALKPITPIGGATVFGNSYIFRVEAEDEDGYDGVNFVGFQVEGQTSWISLVREITTNGIWFTYWDTTALSDGTYNITIVAQDNEGIVVKKVISVTIANGGAAVAPPSIALTLPAKDSTIFGPELFQATTGGIVSVVEFYVDNQLTATMSNTGGNNWQYSLDATFWDDGTHVVIVIARNAAGEAADAGTYIVDNWDLNFLDITQPAYGSIVTGTISITGDFEADNSGDNAELYVDDNFLMSTDTVTDLGGGDMAFDFSLDTTVLEDGPHHIKMFVYDPDGNRMMDTVMVVVDNTQPSTPIIISVLDDQYLQGAHTFQVYHDGADLDGIQITITTVVTDIPMGFNSASGYYEYTLDTNAVSDGDYSVTANAVDAAGNPVASLSVDFHVDNNAPVLTVTSPMDNEVVSGNVIFAYTAPDPFLQDVMYKVDGNPWVDIATTWNTNLFDDGAHTVKIRARDIAGHESMETLTLVVDNTLPLVYINNPMPSQYVQGIFTFQIMARDDAGIDEVRMSIDNMDLPQTVINDVIIGFNAGTGYYEYTMDTTVLLDGNYNISATSYDNSDYKSAMVVVDFMIDNTVPDLTILSPDNYAYVSGSVLVNVNATDVFYDTTMYRAAGSGWTDIAEPWDTTTVEDGTYTVLIMATDLSGKKTTEQLELTVDNNAPEVGINTPVADQFVQGTFTFQVLARDGIGVDEVRISLTDSDSATAVINDIPIGYNSGTGYYECTLDTTVFADGNYTFECTAYDTAGQSSGSLTVDFAVDNNAPILTINSPLEGQLVSGQRFIIAQAEDTFLSSVSYSVDGGGWVDIMVQWDTRDLEDGTHTLSLMAMDYAGHEVVQTINVKTDNNGPELYVVTLPMEDERVGSTFLIQLEVRDALSVSEVTYRFDANDPVRVFVNKNTDFYEAEVMTDESGHDLTDGDHTLYLEATDASGLETELTRTIYVDNSGPRITLTRPSSGQTVDNDVKYQVGVVDGADVEEVYIRINKGVWNEMSGKEGSDTYTYTWNSRGVYNGEYDVDIRAVDGLGNENEKSATINVDNFPLTIFIIFIIGLVVFLILVVVSWSKGPKSAPPKKKKEAEAPEETGEEDISQPPEKAMITELSEDDEEDLPPPPMKASMVELADDSEVREVFECPECGTQLTEFDTICPKCGVELADDDDKSPGEPNEEELDKLEPPAPEEET